MFYLPFLFFIFIRKTIDLRLTAKHPIIKKHNVLAKLIKLNDIFQKKKMRLNTNS